MPCYVRLFLYLMLVVFYTDDMFSYWAFFCLIIHQFSLSMNTCLH